jgi:hypothetical protein
MFFFMFIGCLLHVEHLRDFFLPPSPTLNVRFDYELILFRIHYVADRSGQVVSGEGL